MQALYYCTTLTQRLLHPAVADNQCSKTASTEVTITEAEARHQSAIMIITTTANHWQWAAGGTLQAAAADSGRHCNHCNGGHSQWPNRACKAASKAVDVVDECSHGPRLWATGHKQQTGSFNQLVPPPRPRLARGGQSKPQYASKPVQHMCTV